jgi:pre-mRNA-splicing factor 38B
VVSDDEVFQVQASSSAAEMTMGEYICQLFGELEYYGTRLPRLPTDVERDLKVRLLHAKKVEDRAKHHAASVRSMDHFQRLGSKVRALYEDEQNPIRWYDAVIDRVISTDPETGEALKRPRFVVTFPEYGNTETVSLGEIDVVGGEGVGIERGGQWERGGRAGHDEQLGHNGNNNYQRRQYKDGYRRGCSDDQRKHGRDRNRSRSRSRDRGVDNKAGLLEEVLRREPQSTTTSGNKAYASRPPSTKASLSASFNNRKRASFEDDGEYQPMRQTLPTPVATTNQQPPPLDKLRREKTPEEIAAIAEKKRKLMDKYG